MGALSQKNSGSMESIPHILLVKVQTTAGKPTATRNWGEMFSTTLESCGTCQFPVHTCKLVWKEKMTTYLVCKVNAQIWLVVDLHTPKMRYYIILFPSRQLHVRKITQHQIHAPKNIVPFTTVKMIAEISHSFRNFSTISTLLIKSREIKNQQTSRQPTTLIGIVSHSKAKTKLKIRSRWQIEQVLSQYSRRNLSR